MFDEKTALIVVDMQNDFLEGGALACHQANEIIKPIDDLLNMDNFDYLITTQDWHPKDHVSFGRHSTTPGWGEHCVQGTKGAELTDKINWDCVDHRIFKGQDKNVDSYSAFFENPTEDGYRHPTGLAGWMKEREVTHVYVCGLARDVCVFATAMDAKQLGFNVNFLWYHTRPTVKDASPVIHDALLSNGIPIKRGIRIPHETHFD